jgi:hypothetical protein
MFTAIGPGGKKIEMQPLFQTDNKKPNLFSSGPAETKNFFTQPSATSNLFQTSTNSIFQANTEKPGLFSQQPSTAQSGGLFAQGPTNIFGGNSLFGSNQTQSKPLFGAADNSLFGK